MCIRICVKEEGKKKRKAPSVKKIIRTPLVYIPNEYRLYTVEKYRAVKIHDERGENSNSTLEIRNGYDVLTWS